MIKRGLWTALAVVLCVISFAVCAYAAEGEGQAEETMPSSYAELEGYLPDEVVDRLPEGMLSSDPETAIQAVQEASSVRYLLSAVLDAVGLRMGEAVTLLCTLVGLLLLAALLRHLKNTVGGKVGALFGFALRLSLYAAIVGQVGGMLSVVGGFFEELRGLTVGMIPVMGTLYAIGGNVGQAAVNQEILLIFLTVIQYVSTAVTPPLCGVCMTFSLMDALESRWRLSPLAGLIKKWYTSLLGFCMFLLATALSLQSVLASKSDTWALKGVKYAVGSWIPVVGGAVSGSLGTVATVVDAMRGVCGACGVILLSLLLLPTLIQVLLFRWMLQLSSATASLLDCDGEAKLLGEMGSLYGYMAAAVSVCALLFALALGLLMGSASALS